MRGLEGLEEVLRHAEAGGVLARRQELPEEAFVTVDELRRLYEADQTKVCFGKDVVVPIIAISAW